MKDMSYKSLLEIRRSGVKIAPKIEHVIRGSIVKVSRSCGKPSCRCSRGSKHRSIYISQRHNGKTRMIYVPPRAEKEALRLIQNYHRLKIAIDRASEYNVLLLGMMKGRKKLSLDTGK